MGTIITALIIVGVIAGAICLLMYVHNRDLKRNAKKTETE